MEVKKLIEQLENKHKEWLSNLSVEEYLRDGEEEFTEWLLTQANRYLSKYEEYQEV